ncbi:hypothetical protein SAMD00019534_113480, partial [Acytostelium subglobosum LB1]|uniref:hypothetical protein n=1 Tax=Acytostelium subglobosum LB1 TaxID=1410327 RepID=UPI00064489D1
QEVVITIPVGNYSRLSLQDTIQTQLIQQSPNQLTYSITWPTSKQPNTGFNQDSINNFENGQLTSTNVIDLQIENILYIHSDLCSNGSDDVLQEHIQNS